MKKREQQIEQQSDHGTATFPCTVYEYDAPVENSEKIYCHWHRDVELLYILEGNATLTINQETHAIQKGDFILIPVSQVHMVTGDTFHPFRFIAVLFHPDFISSFGSDAVQQKYIEPLLQWEFNCSPVIHNCLFFHDMLSDVVLCWHTQADGYELQIKSDLIAIFTRLYSLVSCHRETIPSSSDYRIALIKDLISFIQEHYMENISLSHTASAFSISRGYLCHFFREMTNMSFTEYVNLYRISISCRQLKETDLPVSAIAERVGFQNISYFNRTFRKFMSVSPQHYRKQHLSTDPYIM